MPDSAAPLGYALRQTPVFLRWTPTRTTARPVGYVLPPAMASVVPLLLDHDIAVYRFRDSTQLDAEVYHATSVSRDEYFQGHYLKSVQVEKERERITAHPGWFWIPAAQSRANLISYLMEPETDDNLITWGWADHLLQVRPKTVDEAMAGMEEELASLSEEQRAQFRARMERQLTARQRVPMMRIMTHQRIPAMRVEPVVRAQRNVYSVP
jgi:hypothetical protein